jgi:hypothetical protein
VPPFSKKGGEKKLNSYQGGMYSLQRIATKFWIVSYNILKKTYYCISLAIDQNRAGGNPNEK